MSQSGDRRRLLPPFFSYQPDERLPKFGVWPDRYYMNEASSSAASGRGRGGGLQRRKCSRATARMVIFGEQREQSFGGML
jgi:hypothetical protein